MSFLGDLHRITSVSLPGHFILFRLFSSLWDTQFCFDYFLSPVSCSIIQSLLAKLLAKSYICNFKYREHHSGVGAIQPIKKQNCLKHSDLCWYTSSTFLYRPYFKFFFLSGFLQINEIHYSTPINYFSQSELLKFVRLSCPHLFLFLSLYLISIFGLITSSFRKNVSTSRGFLN